MWLEPIISTIMSNVLFLVLFVIVLGVYAVIELFKVIAVGKSDADVKDITKLINDVKRSVKWEQQKKSKD